MTRKLYFRPSDTHVFAEIDGSISSRHFGDNDTPAECADGHRKDPNNPKRWIADDEAAAVVRRIYRLSLEGLGIEQIAAALESENVMTPMNYWESKGLARGGKQNRELPNHWNSSTVSKILSLQECCGDVINFKTYSKSFKLKRRIQNNPENMAVFKDVHEAIVSRSDWEKVQARHQQKTPPDKRCQGQRG
jgi:hypothetical protein